MHIGVGEDYDSAESDEQKQQSSAEQRARIEGIAGDSDGDGMDQIDASQYDGANAPEQILRKTQVGEADEFLGVADQFIGGRRGALPAIVGTFVGGIDLNERVLFQAGCGSEKFSKDNARGFG